ncbi:DUF2752 domain-containing protein [Solwaraspora sp. WMMD937]|uniref:DUF2752 domain-containing protein n=1 Tax=Solwaraspora sp. WMMD937 TaxID=3016090 RepID=UPI00249ADE9D|nr:DUF2752 domain-containing protein [Solwaraspora sp. WMMD937]WFE19358.1 DUF2752 domain-containing protein [Solwaraspora sp. WMMD937]
MAGPDGVAVQRPVGDGPTPPGDAGPYPDDHSHYHQQYAYQPQAQPDRFTRLVNRLWVRSPRWLAPLAVLGCIGAAAGYTVITDPTTSNAEAAPSCLLKLTTGLDCPGCGGTRAVWYLLNGDLGAAARHHLLVVFAVPFLLYVYLAWVGQQLFRWRLPQLSLSPTAVGWSLGVWLAFSVLRNLPWEPFSWFYV